MEAEESKGQVERIRGNDSKCLTCKKEFSTVANKVLHDGSVDHAVNCDEGI